ncbi:MFS transporter [Salinisphaera sp. Q1T1-3]|uniref:CynX/NimT family MFS transporter n=1 Tax=Salinisphaera sp. Q1T1-3 TaxID=2321229 RepID=UPI000E72B976|nr:MFS transporter [Salinisphaera sp. Q1T1-3]RJS94091.1 MFS transporter [Salinisphaera sp. Q1T1-3]
MSDKAPDATLARRLLTLAGLLLVAINLRPALTSVAPILDPIGRGLSLGAAGQSVLTTLPVLCLGLAAPLAPRLAARFGPERAVLGVLIGLTAALGLRPFLGTSGLFVGTALAGGCIGIMGVLLPGLVKRDFPTQIGLMTGLYTMMLNLGAAGAAGVTEPLRLAFDQAWQPALAFWLVPAVIAIVAWIAQLRGTARPARTVHRGHGVYRSALAWQVTVFMGLQSSLAYIVFGWLPTMLADRGMAPVAAGVALSVSILLQVSTALAVPWLATRLPRQRAVLVGVVLVTLCGLAGCFYAPLGWVWVSVVVLGLGQGGSFAMALTLLALRAPDAASAAELSGMAQGVGYVMAALGPFAVGLIHDLAGGWGPVGILLALIGAGAMLAGLGAGRDRQLGDRPAGR